MEVEKLTSSIITKHLMHWVAGSSDIVIPNYYIGAWECDVLKISRAGQTYEYEVKVSRADFRNDFNKSRRLYNSPSPERKHDNILSGKRVNRFYYVVPAGLITPEEVPGKMGLIYASRIDNEPVRFRIVKMAGRLSKTTFSPENYRHVATNLSMKLITAKLRY